MRVMTRALHRDQTENAIDWQVARYTTLGRSFCLCLLPTAYSLATGNCATLALEISIAHVIDADLPGGYQVEVADVNGDKKPDIVALGGSNVRLVREPDLEEADRHIGQANARHHQHRHGRP